MRHRAAATSAAMTGRRISSVNHDVVPPVAAESRSWRHDVVVGVDRHQERQAHDDAASLGRHGPFGGGLPASVVEDRVGDGGLVAESSVAGEHWRR